MNMNIRHFLLFTICFTLSAFSCFAQADGKPAGQVTVYDGGAASISDKWIEINKRTDGRIPGYRIKIYFGVDREKANTVKQNFLLKYPDAPSYVKYEQPNFIIVAGDFRTRLEAYKFLKDISPDYPYAFIVKDNIELPKLKAGN